MKRLLAGVAFAVILMSVGIMWIDDKTPTRSVAFDPMHDGTFVIGGKSVTLKSGYSEVANLGSSSKTITRYFGNDATGDINGDGRIDRAFLITQEMGGSGTFFYVVGLLDTPAGNVGTDGVLLGDRIAPQNTSIDSKGTVLVNYADRKVTDSFASPATEGKSLYLKLDPATLQFGEVVQVFDGAHSMTLQMKKWNWVNTIYGDGKEVKPLQANRFSLTFQSNGKFSATTDCNSIAGSYVTNAKALTFSNMVSTLIGCGPSQEHEFTDMLTQTKSYSFTSQGELIMNLNVKNGAFIFR